MVSTQSTASVHWRIFTRSDRATSTNKWHDNWQNALGTFAFLASTTVHTVIIALLINNAAEPLPAGRPLVVELVVVQEKNPTIGDSSTKLKSSEKPIITGDIDANIAEIELKLTDLQIPAPKAQKKHMGGKKHDRLQHLKSNTPVPKPRRKPPTQPKTQQSAALPKNDKTVLPSILEEAAGTVANQDDGPKLRGIQIRLPEEVQTKNEGFPGRKNIASIGRGGLETKNHVGSEDIGEATQLPGNPPPTYPARAVRRGWQGRVILDVEVLPSGKTGLVRIATSSGHRVLDKSAQNTVKKWQFKAARRAGIPYRSRVRVPVQFRLER